MIGRYARKEAAEVWSDAHRYALWLDVEIAACGAMEEAGIVPAGTADSVRRAARIDPQRVAEIEARTRHDVIAFLTHVEESCGEPARWLHLGMTSSDVLDSAFALQLRQAVDLLIEGVDRLLVALRRRAEEHRRTPMIGRTHGMHAEPTTAGLVFLRFYDEMARNRARLLDAREVVSVGKISGAVGVYGGTLTPAIEARALSQLGLSAEPVASQVVARDRHAVLFARMAICAATIEKLALQLRHWQRTEVGEAEEPFAEGQKGSSAMPHKRNPILSENLSGLARLMRAYATAAIENVALWHERDISHSSVERVIAPDATVTLDFMLHRAAGLVEGLVVRPERMRENLARHADLVFSEAVLTALIRRGLGRQQAYELVQRHAMAALRGERPFRAGLESDAEVHSRIEAAELAACFDLEHHLGHVDAIFERALGSQS
ncbi:MAG: adenylosuccinate lyase [Myxococcota bacterium]